MAANQGVVSEEYKLLRDEIQYMIKQTINVRVFAITIFGSIFALLEKFIGSGDSDLTVICFNIIYIFILCVISDLFHSYDRSIDKHATYMQVFLEGTDSCSMKWETRLTAYRCLECTYSRGCQECAYSKDCQAFLEAAKAKTGENTQNDPATESNRDKRLKRFGSKAIGGVGKFSLEILALAIGAITLWKAFQNVTFMSVLAMILTAALIFYIVLQIRIIRSRRCSRFTSLELWRKVKEKETWENDARQFSK